MASTVYTISAPTFYTAGQAVTTAGSGANAFVYFSSTAGSGGTGVVTTSSGQVSTLMTAVPSSSAVTWIIDGQSPAAGNFTNVGGSIMATSGGLSFQSVRFFFAPNASTVQTEYLKLSFTPGGPFTFNPVGALWTGGGGWTVAIPSDAGGSFFVVVADNPTQLMSLTVSRTSGGSANSISYTQMTQPPYAEYSTGSGIGLQAVMTTATSTPVKPCLHSSTVVQLADGWRVCAGDLVSGDAVRVAVDAASVDTRSDSWIAAVVEVYQMPGACEPLYAVAPGVIVTENHTIACRGSCEEGGRLAEFVPPPDGASIVMPAGFTMGLARTSGFPRAPAWIPIPCTLVHICLPEPLQHHMFFVGEDESVLSEGYRSDPGQLILQGAHRVARDTSE
jgi:hypothetical protein